MSADPRPSVLERAFALADSGRFNNLNELRAALKAERYGDEQFLGGPGCPPPDGGQNSEREIGKRRRPARGQILTEGPWPAHAGFA